MLFGCFERVYTHGDHPPKRIYAVCTRLAAPFSPCTACLSLRPLGRIQSRLVVVKPASEYRNELCGWCRESDEDQCTSCDPRRAISCGKMCSLVASILPLTQSCYDRHIHQMDTPSRSRGTSRWATPRPQWECSKRFVG